MADARRRSPGGQFGVKAGDGVDFGGAMAHRDKVIKTLTGGVAVLFNKNKIELIEGTAR